ncbi:MAG: urease accessory protein UreE [Betaproteobacteria bacterium]|nr:urease accessory protein UreE [Betaproteobacteria bacterium]
MLRLTQVLGNASDARLGEALHRVEHAGGVEILTVSRADTARRRLHAFTDRGTEVGIMLDRQDRLSNGAVLLLEPGRAIVVRLDEPQWLALVPRDAAAALELGYFCGNMHWKVRFVAEMLHVSMEGPRDDYLRRIAHLVDEGKVRVIADE